MVENSAVALRQSFGYDFDVDTTQILIRRLAPSEAAAYRGIRLDALRCSPEAFGSTFEAESARPIERFAERLSNCTVFGAFRGDEIVGMAGFMGQKARRMRIRACCG